MTKDSDTPDRIARIAEKVRGRSLVGPRLSELEIQTFERLHGVLLPDDYRAFLRDIGSGGPFPPHCGWSALGEVPIHLGVSSWTDHSRIREPFPFRKHWLWDRDETSDEGTIDQAQDGSLYVGDDGCGQLWFLVINGPERGNMWQLCDVGILHTIPKRNFLEWYEDYFDGVRDWFG